MLSFLSMISMHSFGFSGDSLFFPMPMPQRHEGQLHMSVYAYYAYFPNSTNPYVLFVLLAGPYEVSTLFVTNCLAEFIKLF